MNAAFVRETVLQVLAEAPGSPRSQEDLPVEEQVLLQIWTAASMYSLDTSLTKAGGTFAWSKALKDKLEELRKTQWIDLLQQQVDSLFPPLGENIASDRRDGTSKRLVDVVSRMLETFGDPYAQYYPPEEWSEINDVAAGRDVVGIGVAFAQDTARGRGAAPEVVSVVPKSPAAEKGVRVSDRLVEVDGKRVRTPSDAARWIPGLPGTIANVKFQRSMPWAPPVEYAVGVQRQGMRVDAVEFQQLSDVAGCIHIISFNGPDVIAPVQRALQQMERLGLFVLVVDLRENCGGRLRDALKIAEMLRAAAFLKALILTKCIHSVTHCSTCTSPK